MSEPLSAGAAAAQALRETMALIQAGKAAEARARLEPLLASAPGLLPARRLMASVLHALGDLPGAEREVRAALAIDPRDAQSRDALARLRAEAGRKLQEQDRHAEAEAAYREAVDAAPRWPEGHRALSDLVWMRTADMDQAAASLEAVLATQPDPVLLSMRARLDVRDEAPERAYRRLIEGLARWPGDRLLEASAASAAALIGDADAALDHARRAAVGAPPAHPMRMLLAETCLGAGRPEEAAQRLQSILAQNRFNQQALALLATAWRLMGDPRAGELYDYDRMVQAFTLPTPKGWADLPAFLADLKATLTQLHALSGHPLEQSLRGGTQTSLNLAGTKDPVIRALFEALDGPIRAYIASLGPGEDPLRARNQGGYAYEGAWSVRLRPGGSHVDHLHPSGWISSAFYVDLPPAMGGEEKAGWIRFGAPGAPTRPKLGAERYVEPQPGRLVLFPSYMFHGTEPFGGEGARLTLAFDLIPAAKS